MNEFDYSKPIKLQTSRAWRTYLGGSMIDKMHGAEREDSNFPEEWLMSTISARNSGRENIVEGISYVYGTDITLKQLIEEEPYKMIGKKYTVEVGKNLGVLVKLLDSAERLTIQVHPTKECAKALFNSQFGKTECWHILECRDNGNTKPSIYLGFKKGITKEKWKKCFDTQNIEEMLKCLNHFEVKSGDTYIVRGGVPHAIGEGCFLVEIQEPTDYTIRTERVTPSGLKVEDFMCHQGLGFEKMFECFEYVGYSEEEVKEKFKIVPRKNVFEGYIEENIIYSEITNIFELDIIEIDSEYILKKCNRFSGLYILDGEGIMDDKKLSKCDHYFVPYECGDVSIKNTGIKPLKIIRFYGKSI